MSVANSKGELASELDVCYTGLQLDQLIKSLFLICCRLVSDATWLLLITRAFKRLLLLLNVVGDKELQGKNSDSSRWFDNQLAPSVCINKKIKDYILKPLFYACLGFRLPEKRALSKKQKTSWKSEWKNLHGVCNSRVN